MKKRGVPGAKARREPPETKKGLPGAKGSTGRPDTFEAAARYSPTPSRVQYHRRAWP